MKGHVDSIISTIKEKNQIKSIGERQKHLRVVVSHGISLFE